MFRKELDKVLVLVDGTVDQPVGTGGSIGWKTVGGNGDINVAWLDRCMGMSGGVTVVVFCRG